MQLTIGGKKYTFLFTVEATLCDDLMEKVIGTLKDATYESSKTAENLATVQRLTPLVKSLFYGGLLQMHGSRGDGSVTSKADAEDLLFQYMTENQNRREGTLFWLYNALQEQMSEDNFLSRIGLTEEAVNEKVTPISKTKKPGGGEE